MQTDLESVSQERIIDGVALRARLSAAFEAEGENATGTVKLLLAEALFQGRNLAKQRLEAGENGWLVARLLSGVADEVVSALFDYTTTHVFRARNPTEGERFALVAVGGYGRGELAPGSDLDLLFLRPYKQTPFAESVTEYLLYILWDLGLKVGQSSRNIDECIKLAREDHTIQTALLEARCVAGDVSLAAELSARYRKEIAERGHAVFIAAKLKERDARHLRIGASRYMVEPNIKEGKGGLRDLHTLFWMARRRYGYTSPRDYIDAGVFTAEEFHTFRRALSFLWSVRCHLHFVAGRAEEKLTFDLQPELAKRMGYNARAGQSAVERFMKRYFLVAKEVGALTRILCAKLETDNAKTAPRGLQRFWPAPRLQATPVAPGFHVDGGRLCIDGPTVFDAPSNLMALFSTAEARDLDIHPAALHEAARRVRRVLPAWRDNAEARAAFLAVATSPRNPGGALRLMNEAGVLGKFVPEFGRVVGQMQFNMYHHYTVDEHTLQAVEAMSEIEQGRHRDQHPLATDIFAKIINRRALYLAMLLHDTGKGDGDQQVEGAKSARAACERLGLPAEEVDLVAWLVGNHLVMSELAQKRDISDPRTVAQLAGVVGSVEHLRMLLVLTVADIRAVGPGLWNDWKGQLLRDLYRLTEATLHGGRSDEEGVRAHLAELASQARQKLADDLGADGDAKLSEGWFESFEDGYWLNHDGEALAWHAREMSAVAVGATPYVATRVRPAQGITEVLIYADDHPGLFANLAAAISAAGADIAGARVHTTRGGAAFDVLSIQTTNQKPFGSGDPGALASLAARLRRAAVEEHKLPPAIAPSRRNAAFTVEPWVRIDNDISLGATVIEASGRDRLGLLAELAHVCAAARISIVSAHIDTHGARAFDTFYVQEENGGQVADSARMEALRAALETVLSTGVIADSAHPSWAVAPASSAR
jgi:[protein-PII] uridylyltransferase